MKPKRIALLLIFTIIGLQKIYAQNDLVYHLQFDDSKMKKYIYEANGKVPDKGFCDFRLPLSKEVELVFRVINNSRYFEEVNKLETEALECSDSIFNNLNFIESINKKEKKLYIIIKNIEKNNYLLLPVRKIFVQEENKNEFSYRDEVLINFQKNNLKQGVNIDSSGGRILFKGKSKMECLNQYQFRVYNKKELRFYEDYFFAENIGLTKILKDDAVMELSSINDISLEDYLKNICSKKDSPQVQKPVVKTENLTKSDTATSNYNATDSLDKDGYYTVKKEDNLYKIARKFNTKIDILMAINKLNSDKLELGQKLKITDNQNYKDSNPYFRTDPESGLEQKLHTVRQGESLWKIASLYKTNAAKLKEINKLSSDNINIGQELIIEFLEKK